MIRRLIILLLIVGCGQKVSENNPNGIKWGNNLDSAFAIASKSDKTIMIDFMAEWCPPCKEMDKITFSNTNIIKKSNEFLLIIFLIHLYIQSHHSSVDTIDVLHSFLHSSLMPSVVKVVEPVLIVPSIIIMGLMGLVAHPTISNNIISLRIIGDN